MAGNKLSNADRDTIRRARELAALTGTDTFRERYGETDGDMARAEALGEAQHLLGELAYLAERLAGGNDPHNVAARVADLERRASQP